MRTKRKWKMATAVCLLSVLLVSVITVSSYSEQSRSAAAAYTYTDAKPKADGLIIPAADAITEGTSAKLLPEWKGRQHVLEWMEGQSVEWKADITKASKYQLSIGYYPLAGSGQDIEFQISVDGKPLTKNNEPFKLNRVWRDESGKIKQSRGNDLRPKQEEQSIWLDTTITLPGNELGGGALVLDLTQGQHVIRLTSSRESAVIDYLHLFQGTAVQDYSAYHAGQAKSSEVSASDGGKGMIEVQAEQAYLKSSAGLFPTMDRTSPLTTPYDPVKMRINTIGGSNWDTPGQWISWKLEVPEDGWYKLGVRYHQNKIKDSFVSRTIYMDGEVPFSELSQVRFPYHLDWAVKELGEETGEPYLFHLAKGTHEIKMEVTLGDMAPSISSVKSMVAELQEIYRKIVMITSVRPDTYRDYELDKSIPGFIADLQQLKARMEEEAGRLEKLTGSNNNGSRSLMLLVSQLEGFIDRPDSIPKRLDSYKTNMTALADWMLNVSSQPLELDYLYVASADVDKPKAEANVLQKGIHELRAFAGSFLENYDSMGDDKAGRRSITVWTGLGRDQAYVVKRLIDETFTPETGINVQFNLVENSLVVAVMAGEGPDVNLLTSRGDTMNLAIRGALEPLDPFTGFDQLPGQYMPSAMVPYQYQNHTYGIPEEQEFFMMFYREDVLKDLGIEAPQTWADLMKIAPELQNHNMQIGLPYENLDAFQLLTRGMGTLNLLPSLLMQNGSGVYNKDLTATRFDEPSSFKAFKQWTDFYKLFDYPLYKDDFNRFRTGEMPIVISSYKLYNRLVKAAPEITGTWKMVPMPGVKKADNTIDRSTGATGTASIILKKAADKKDAWTFLQWWNTAETQTRFAKELENELGVLGRRSPANVQAFTATNWSRAEQQALMEQWQQVKEIPELPGGYYTSRNIDNAFRSVVFQNENARESLFYWNNQINAEIERKRYEFGVKP
ncbi:ABC transporter substrate-binding protein [Paenibacillus baekrokdamisoli]|uniref:ABC transporter substrate-binding protein n=1 Tax=Paenibacillus baekrokdamisoli TaxID=1712516 RepID=A0A3G9JMD9_9BACL|nr:extracellular solute-binding protein [Paenibacillus baekrokdamisoli]MBB3071819.1 ABC-type glycerol-3-phosphate transport system substrate-binding protein [Paenibacillus baekrokdamisoli]BBH24199.1 ABC transporter substrate-binding protein [Paenibacillus baekrokdamisoli]